MYPLEKGAISLGMQPLDNQKTNHLLTSGWYYSSQSAVPHSIVEHLWSSIHCLCDINVFNEIFSTELKYLLSELGSSDSETWVLEYFTQRKSVLENLKFLSFVPQLFIVSNWVGTMWIGTAWMKCISTVMQQHPKLPELLPKNWDFLKVIVTYHCDSSKFWESEVIFFS